MPKIPYSKRKDGRYYKQIVVGVDQDGKRKVKTLYDKDWRELDKKVRTFQLNIQQGKYIEKYITLNECIELWWGTKVGLRDATVNNYRSTLKNLDEIKHFKIKDIKPIHIQSIYTTLFQNDSQTKITALNSLLKNIFKFAQNNNFITENIMDRVLIPKIKKREKRRSLFPEEKKAISLAFNDFSVFEKTLISLFLYTGMRRNEVLALKNSDINMDEGYIYVNKTLVQNEKWETVVQNTPKSLSGIRKIPIIPRLRIFLEEINFKNLPPNEYIFLSKNNKLIGAALFYYKWKCIIDKVNKYMPNEEKTNITPHFFRHNFATDLVYAGIPLKTVQYIMGHENISVTMDIYTDIRENSIETVAKLENYLSNTTISNANLV